MKEEELLKKRLLELAQKSYSQNVYKHTHFLMNTNRVFIKI